MYVFHLSFSFSSLFLRPVPSFPHAHDSFSCPVLLDSAVPVCHPHFAWSSEDRVKMKSKIVEISNILLHAHKSFLVFFRLYLFKSTLSLANKSFSFESITRCPTIKVKFVSYTWYNGTCYCRSSHRFSQIYWVRGVARTRGARVHQRRSRPGGQRWRCRHLCRPASSISLRHGSNCSSIWYNNVCKVSNYILHCVLRIEHQ